MTPHIRIQNDFTVQWGIFLKTEEGREEYNLEGKELILRLQNPYKTENLTNFIVRGNVIEWTFLGKDQKAIGPYTLILVENQGKQGMATIDKVNAFTLVAHTEEETGNDEGAVTIQTIHAESETAIFGGGLVDEEFDSESKNAIANKTVTRAFAEAAEVLAGKQETIADLDVIRNGASKGATALQEVPDNYATKKDLTDGLSGKVNKVEGKQLSTEDFTTILKEKLESLSNYDDTAISEALAALRVEFDTLLSGNPTQAINSFNEIIAFLEGVEDSENLDSIIASIELQIAGKQDKIEDLDAIREGASKGATALQEHQDISGKVDKVEGKGLSTNDYTNQDQERVARIPFMIEGLNTLDWRIGDLIEKLSASAHWAYDEVRGLLESRHLQPYRPYVITDYVASSTQADTKVVNGWSLLIVQAISPDALSEDAYLLSFPSKDDLDNGNMKNARLYRVKYDIFNDASKYTWAHCNVASKINDPSYELPCTQAGGFYEYKFLRPDSDGQSVAFTAVVQPSDPIGTKLAEIDGEDVFLKHHEENPRLLKLGAHPSNSLGFEYITTGKAIDLNGVQRTYHRFEPNDGNPDVYVVVDDRGNALYRANLLGDGYLEPMMGYDIQLSPAGRGVIYYMEDDRGNIAPYDYLHILFRRERVKDEIYRDIDGRAEERYGWFARDYLPGFKFLGRYVQKRWMANEFSLPIRVFLEPTSDYVYFYTFGTWESTGTSKEASKVFRMCQIEPTYTAIGFRRQLNNNIIVFNEALGGNAQDITSIYLGEYCYDTSIRNSSNIHLEGSSGKNMIIESSNVRLGKNCYNNQIEGSQDVTMASKCSYNTVQTASLITLNALCENNIIKDGNTCFFGYGCLGIYTVGAHHQFGSRCLFLDLYFPSSVGVKVEDRVSRFGIDGQSVHLKESLTRYVPSSATITQIGGNYSEVECTADNEIIYNPMGVKCATSADIAAAITTVLNTEV